MDSLADHSLISRIITVADVVDQIISHVWLHRWNLLLALPHYIFFAKPVDLYLLLLTSAYNYRARIALWSLDGPSLQAAAAFFTVVISTCFVLPHFISANQRNELGSRLGPVIIPGRTTHTRLFPKTHKFSYPYLMVAVPVGLRGNINCLLSLDEDTKQLNTWQRWAMLATPYKVDGQDYLERRECAGGLRGKLDYFLKSKDIDPIEFPHAILVTSPRLFGYAFNPASFWYLYSPDKVLAALVIEVNNTFGEMRPYLIFNETSQDTSKHDSTNASLSDTPGGEKKFTANWPKDFHVSPFNSRKGRYSIKTEDPMAPGMKHFRNVNITASLSSSKSHAKLVAKLFGDRPPIPISSMSLLRKIAFVAKWTWIPFATVPRILYEASRLYFNRSLHVWERPEPLAGTVSRKASEEEETIEKIFRDYLRWKVETSNDLLTVAYHPPKSMPGRHVERFTSHQITQFSDAREHLDFKILTPSFYSRFVAYDHDIDAISAEYWEARTFDTDKFQTLINLFPKSDTQTLSQNATVGLFLARLIKQLRQRPTRTFRPLSSEEKAQGLSDPATVAKPISQSYPTPMSPMDVYVWEHCTGEAKARYVWALTRLFLSHRLFWGFKEGFTVMQLSYRLLVAHLVANSLFLVDGV